MLDSFTQFWFSHLDSIVNVLFLVLILLFMVLFVVIFISSKNKKDTEIHSDDLEKTLRKVLESAELRSAPMPMPSGSTDVSSEASQEVSNLKKSIEDKVAEVENLKKQIAEKQNSGSGGGGGDASGLQLRLKELEAKLAEYEVIEDDIANLSMYKEENKRLRSELDKLGGDNASDEDTVDEIVNAVTSDEAEAAESDEEITSESVEEDPPVEEEVPVEAEAPVEEEIVPAPEPIVAKVIEKTEAPKVETPAPVEAATEEVDSNEDDILGEFVQAVAEQGTKVNPKPEVAEKVEAVKEEPEVKEEIKTKPLVEDENAKADDIMAEFEAAAAKVNTSVKATEPSTETKDEISPLEENTDTDKILNEMDSLLSAEKAPEAEDDIDPSEKLIGEFESLTKTKT